jgi:hypothetical protein
MEPTAEEFDAAVAAANRHGAALQANTPAIASVNYDPRIARIVIHLASGLDLAFSPKDAEGFENATPADLDEVVISPSGLGIHFPKIDADIYLPALLDGVLGSRRWLAAETGRAGGKVKSSAKSNAARENGKLGGRPKKKIDKADLAS